MRLSQRAASTPNLLVASLQALAETPFEQKWNGRTTEIWRRPFFGLLTISLSVLRFRLNLTQVYKSVLEAGSKLQVKELSSKSSRSASSFPLVLTNICSRVIYNASLISFSRDTNLKLSIFYCNQAYVTQAVAANAREIEIARELDKLTEEMIKQMAKSKSVAARSFLGLKNQVENFDTY